MRRLGEERGQSIVEWLGGMVVLLVVVIATFSVKPSLGQQLSCQPKPDRALLRARDRAAYNLSQNRIDRNAIRPGR